MNERAAADDGAARRVAGPISESGGFERTLAGHLPWSGWRLRILVATALLGCLATFTLARLLAATPHLDADWQVTAQRQLTLIGAVERDLLPFVGRTLQSISSANGSAFAVSALALQRSPRWQVDDGRRTEQIVLQKKLGAAFADGQVTLHFSDGSRVDVETPRRGITGLGLLFAPLCALALALALLGCVAMVARPQWRNALYLLMALCQAGNLFFVALASAPGLGQVTLLADQEMLWRMAFDGTTAAAVVHAFALHPRRLPQARLIAAAAWGVTGLVLLLALADALTPLWWWAQGLPIALGTMALVVVSASHRIEANPYAALMRRIAAVTLATLALVTLAAAAAADQPGMPQSMAAFGAIVWTVYMASLLLLTPFLARARQLLREFALLAGIGTIAISLDQLFVAVFAFGAVASLTLAVLLALGAYVVGRQWILNQMAGSGTLTAEHAFEQLYRVAHEMQEQPTRRSRLFARLLRDLFEPVEIRRVDRPARHARVIGGGSALLVPMRDLGSEPADTGALLLRFARQGKRLFTRQDARLADRVVEQLHRIVVYDMAVERGRSEERLRIAQDLHDDIGARLLTLMYQAPNSAMEDYIRDTLKDLKTLTRGLARAEHRLSHASAEWKADIAQRLSMAQIELGWVFEIDQDLILSMVQWSALTRVLRELVSNTIVHAQANRVDVQCSLAGRQLALSVADDGRGRDPARWSSGLGLGGVRKRVKLLGGEVRWTENRPRGIVCEVRIAEFAPRR